MWLNCMGIASNSISLSGVLLLNVMKMKDARKLINFQRIREAQKQETFNHSDNINDFEL